MILGFNERERAMHAAQFKNMAELSTKIASAIEEGDVIALITNLMLYLSVAPNAAQQLTTAMQSAIADSSVPPFPPTEEE